MSRLLFAGFARLKKDKCFWIGMLCMFGLGTSIILLNYDNMVRLEYKTSLDSYIFGYSMFIGIVCSAFCSLFIGTEYSDGTIRNKLIAGHTRAHIYLANFIVCSVAGIFMVLAFLISALVFGIPLFGFFETDISFLLFILFGSLVMTVALTAIFTLICMLNQNKTIAAITAILGSFALLFAAAYISTALEQPETYEGYFLDESGTFQAGSEIPNPYYISGTKRVVYETLLDILPTGQAARYITLTITWQMVFYSFLIALITTFIGIWIFQRKDIK